MTRELIGMIFILLGIMFDFFGVLGLVRLPDVYNRLQAATKCVTFGSAGILFGVFIIQGFNNFGFKVILGIVFIFLTSPVSAHAISRAAHRSKIPLAKESVVDQYQEDNELKD
ncbi:monovalent cation/H(+) antiporter subunit G [bacterium]|nr:monovalent cation/H(+) antiporter subunit G [bacterium]MBU1064773.1 monovalent cation/H(+) antiporter subunit G [bacterium]MBU1633234.1 monovalent cation/H(+) antiporter subunit G [bacterium]MBU1874181.1 monovalent cation/H(+) antiporter subunit G [bacterium]